MRNLLPLLLLAAAPALSQPTQGIPASTQYVIRSGSPADGHCAAWSYSNGAWRLRSAGASCSSASTWANLSGKPSTFPPDSHAHPMGDLTGFSSNVRSLLSGVSPISYDSNTGAISCPTCGNHVHAGTDLTSGIVPAARLGTGTPDSTTFLRGDNTWATPAGGGAASSVASASQSFTGQTSVTITHNFNSLQQVIACYDGSAVEIKPNSVTTGLASTTVTFTSAQTGSCLALGGTGLYSQSFTSQTSVSLTHSLNTQSIIVACYDGSNVLVEPSSVTATSTSAATVTFSAAQTGSCVVAASLALTGGGGGGSGTVTSVGLTVPGGLSVSGSPVTSSGTLAVTTSLSGVVRASGGSFSTVTGSASDCVKVDGSSGACGSGGSGTAGTGIDITSGVVSVQPSTVPSYLSGTASLTYSTFGGTGSCEEQNVTVSGAATGDAVSMGLPASFPAGVVVGAAYVSTPNTVTVRLCRLAGTNTITAQTFRAWVNKTF